MTRHTLTRDAWTRHGSDGQALVVFALLSVVLLGALGLSVDAGMLLGARRQAQNAADAGALAAAQALQDNRSEAEITATGQAYGTYNAGSGSVVTVDHPPSSGAYAGNDNYVQVTVTRPVTKYFIGGLYTGPWQVTATATAGIEDVPRAYALIALRGPGIYVNGDTTITIDGEGSIMSNSDITSSGSSNIVAVGGSIDAVGIIEENDSWSAPSGIHEDQDILPDPLAGTPPPPIPGNLVTKEYLDTLDCDTACVLPGGRYHNLGMITIKGVVTLQSDAIYYFSGNTRIRMIGSNAFIKGSRVLLYFTDTARIDPNTAGIELSAASSSLYPGGRDGMLFWIANCTDFISQGTGVFRVEGIIYAPCSHVELHGTPDSNGMQVIVGDLVLKGTSDFLITYRDWITVQVPKVFLVE